MGACYDVYITPKFIDGEPKAFCDIIRERTAE